MGVAPNLVIAVFSDADVIISGLRSAALDRPLRYLLGAFRLSSAAGSSPCREYRTAWNSKDPSGCW